MNDQALVHFRKELEKAKRNLADGKINKCDVEIENIRVKISYIEDAINALEKQIQKKVLSKMNVYDDDDYIKFLYGNCPCCNGFVTTERLRNLYYCDKCGKKLDWSEDDETD